MDTVAAVLGEEDQSSHIEYFQGFRNFYKRGFLVELPAEVEENILLKPELVEIRNRIEKLEALNSDRLSITSERLNYRKALVRFRLSKLKRYQSS
jgi:hypothetical protein